MSEPIYRYFEGIDGVVPDAAGQVLRLNEVLAEVVFHEGNSGEPVHLDLDDEVTAAIESRLGLDPGNFSEHLVDIVCGISTDGSPESVFRVFSHATKRWNNLKERDAGSLLEVPPALCLLALMTLAAERMRSGSDGDDGKITAAAYYRRLEEVVGRSTWNSTDVQNAYRDKQARFTINSEQVSRAIGLWNSLRDWLAAWETERGICTVSFPKAERRGRWAIELAISQALLREADRENLRRMFDLRNLDPAVPVSDELMYLLLDEWCSNYGSNHLKALWKDVDLRESLVSSARNTLLTWSGSHTEGEESNANLGVVLSIDLNPFARRVDVGIEIRSGAQDCPEWVEVLGQDGERVQTRLIPAGPRAYRVHDYGAFEANALLAGVIKIEAPDVGLRGRRFPRPIVSFLAVNSGNSYVEASSMTLAARHGLLVRSPTSDGHDLLADVEAVLERSARPGWSRVDATKFRGLPEGWVFIQNVELICIPEAVSPESHLGILLPLPVESMSLQGGFRIPGRRDRWLVDAAPEAVISFPFAAAQRLAILDSADNLLYSTEFDSPVAVQPLAVLGLAAGSYTLESTPDSGNPLRKRFSLVTGDTPNPVAMSQQMGIGHVVSPETPFGAITAWPVDKSMKHNLVRGLYFEGLSRKTFDEPVDDRGMIPTSRQWTMNDDSVSRDIENRIQVELAPLNSCLYGRNHHWMIPAKQVKFRSGRCKFCYVVKQEKLTRKDDFSQDSSSPQTRSLKVEDVLAIPALAQEEENKWDRALDVLCYLRTGTTHDIAQVISQLGGGNLGVDRILKHLSVLGHIDVELDERCRPRSWAIGPAVVVVTSPTRAHLAGFRSQNLISEISTRIEASGGRVSRIQNGDAPQVIALEIPTESTFESLFAGIKDPVTGEAIRVQRLAAATLLAAIPVVTDMMTAAPKMGRPAFRKLNKWDGFGARWEGATSDLPAGAYQSIGAGYVYTFHAEDIEMFEEVQTGTAALVKHRESLRAGQPLVFYDARSRILCCRLGADLPGLLARAVVALSGRIPIEDESERIVKYHDVDSSTAEIVFRILRG